MSHKTVMTPISVTAKSSLRKFESFYFLGENARSFRYFLSLSLSLSLNGQLLGHFPLEEGGKREREKSSVRSLFPRVSPTPQSGLNCRGVKISSCAPQINRFHQVNETQQRIAAKTQDKIGGERRFSGQSFSFFVPGE